MLNEKKLALGEDIAKTLTGTDVADPTQRTAAALFVVLKNQLEQLGFVPGTVPFNAQFGSDQARGALLGTAIAVVRGHRETPEREHYVDAIIATFTIVFGEQLGRAKALETIEMSADRNAAVNSASDQAGQDTINTFSDESPSMPTAFYRAASRAL